MNSLISQGLQFCRDGKPFPYTLVHAKFHVVFEFILDIVARDEGQESQKKLNITTGRNMNCLSDLLFRVTVDECVD